MKVLILTCLVALALAIEKEEISVPIDTLESLISNQDYLTQINKQKLEKAKLEEQQQEVVEECQEKIHPLNQQQPLVYPYAEAIPFTALPQGTLTLSHIPVLPAALQPEILQTPKAKENIPLKNKAMPFLSVPTAHPALQLQIPSFPNLKNQHLLLPPLQPAVPQAPLPFPQAPVLPVQSQLVLPQPNLQAIPQQAVPYLQKDMPFQALLLYPNLLFNPTSQLYPVTHLPPVYKVNV